MPSPIDILLPLGKGSRNQNQELRFALRSIERYATNIRRVVIVGEDPGFLSPQATLLRCKEAPGNKEFRIASKIGWAFVNGGLTENVAFWNDDYVLQKPLDVTSIPDYQKGLLRTSIDQLQECSYRHVLADTDSVLKAGGWPSYHYDIHCPIIYNKTRFLSLVNWWKKSRASYAGFGVKSIYGNVYNPDTPGPLMADCKILVRSTLDAVKVKIGNRWIFSYGDDALRGGELLGLLNRSFPNLSRFERH